MALPLAIPAILQIFGGSATKAVGKFIGNYWHYLLIGGLIIFAIYKYGEYREELGVIKTKAYYEQLLKEQAINNEKVLKKTIAEYETLVEEVRKKEKKADEARIKAEAQAAKYRRDSESYYGQLGDLADELKELREALSGGNANRVTYGFVGLHNMAVQIPSQAGTGSTNTKPGLPDVSEAAGLDRGTPTSTLVTESQVTLDQVAETIQYNYEIANQCLNDRKQMKDYIDELCKLGFCK